MKKIISLFVRDWEGDKSRVTRVVQEGAEWVIAGEGVATRKFDGTACMVRAGVLYRRYDAKNGKTPPPDFEPAQEPDAVTGHWPGWIPVKESNPADKWYIAAWNYENGLAPFDDGTYELCGPHFQSNAENMPRDIFITHGMYTLDDCPRDFDGLASYLQANAYEGIVWHHPDGRMVKIKASDFGIKWPRP